MKRKVVMKLLCVTIVSAMLVTNTTVLFASDGYHLISYCGVTQGGYVSGDSVTLDDGTEVSLGECAIVDEPVAEPTPAPEPEPTPEPEPVAPVVETPAEDTKTETPKKEEAVSTTDKKDEATSTTDQKDEATSTTDKKDEATSTTDKKDEATSTTDKKDEATSTTDKKDETTSTTDQKEESTSTTDKKDETSEAPDQKDEAGDVIENPEDAAEEVPAEDADAATEDTTKKEEATEVTDATEEVKEETANTEESAGAEETPRLVSETPEETEDMTLAQEAEEIATSDESSSLYEYITPSVTAGIGFYVDELKDSYHISFEEKFSDVIDEIEKEYIRTSIDKINADNVKKAEEAKKAAEANAEDPQASGTENVDTSAENVADAASADVNVAATTSTDATADGTTEQTVEVQKLNAEAFQIQASNWQDVLAVYLLNEAKAGKTDFVLDASAKEGLAKTFASMNTPTVQDNKLVCQPQYIADYLEKNKTTLSDSDKEFLEKYTEQSFMILCSAATGIAEFIQESLGPNVSAERAQVVAAGYSLVGKISYFWGGKSSVVGWDDRWGSLAEITADGSSSSGSIGSYGLDCSGFVSWAFVNGYQNSAGGSLVGQGTAGQWALSEPITEEEAIPGDLVFLQSPSSSGINHVGIVVGRNEDGSLIAVHCNGSSNGVTVDSAYQAGFRYVRRPLAYTDDAQAASTEVSDTDSVKAQLQTLKDQIAQVNGTAVEESEVVSQPISTTETVTVTTTTTTTTDSKDDPLAWKMSHKEDK